MKITELIETNLNIHTTYQHKINTMWKLIKIRGKIGKNSSKVVEKCGKFSEKK